MSLLFYQLGEQLTFPGPTREISSVRLHYSRIPRLSLTSQLRSKQSTVAFFTGRCIDTECGQRWLSDSGSSSFVPGAPRRSLSRPGALPPVCLLQSLLLQPFVLQVAENKLTPHSRTGQNRRKPVSRTGKTFNFLCLLQMTDCNNPKM